MMALDLTMTDAPGMQLYTLLVTKTVVERATDARIIVLAASVVNESNLDKS